MKKIALLFSVLAIAVLLNSCKKKNKAPEPTPVSGCMDPTSLTYNSLATVDDGSCTYKDTTTVLTNVLVRDDGNTLNGGVRVLVYELNSSIADTMVIADISSETVFCNSNVRLTRLKVDTDYNIVTQNSSGQSKNAYHVRFTKNASGGFVVSKLAGGGNFSGVGIGIIETSLYGLCTDKLVFCVFV
jgi:hypothetical protein